MIDNLANRDSAAPNRRSDGGKLMADTVLAAESEAGSAESIANFPRTTADILWEELRALRPETAASGGTLKDYEIEAQDAQLSALCLSGGGIRSAAFALGVVQALAGKGLLASFDYVSSVSGGGYLNGFLQRWIVADRGTKDRPLPPLGERGVEAALAGGLTGPEPPPVTRMREGANFITPRVGMMSVDTWTAIATTVRNIFVNWTMFLPLFLIVAGIPQIVYWFLSPLPEWGAFAGLALEFAGLTVAMTVVMRSLPSYRSGDKPEASTITLFTLPAIALAAAGAMMVLAADPGLGWSEDQRFLPASGAFVAATVMAWLIALPWSVFSDRLRWRPLLFDFLRWLACSGVAAAVLYWAARPLASYFPLTKTSVENLEWLVAFGPVAFIVSILVAGWVFSAIRSLWLDGSRFKPDLDREWLVRMSAILMKPAFVWLVVVLLTLVSVMDLAPLMMDDGRLSLSGLFATGGALSGAVAAFGGRSGATAMGYARKWLSLETVILLAVLLFSVLTMLAAGLFESWLAQQATAALCGTDCTADQAMWKELAGHGLVVSCLLIWVLALGYLFNVNRFSLNGFYRNRLARAFLGAARCDVRSPDPLTGFDARDNIRMQQLWRRASDAPDIPRQPDVPPDAPMAERRSLFPVINLALNVSATARLAWQERKAEPFIVTPFAAGSGMLNGEGSTLPRGAYVPASEYSGREGDRALPGSGITLADAVSVSGAAVSPNMGYHSSASTAFLMTLFNLRLGAWLPNPAKWKNLGHKDPTIRKTNALVPFLAELSGATDDTTRDVYLSDGGHFENLGLYEMIRRRCRYIFVSDGGCDPAFDFTDLGNAIRKISIDLRTDIVFSEVKLGARSTPVADRLAYAVATIHYPSIDGRSNEPGTLIYLKPSVIENLPMDVNAYAIANLAFPHESTADQWYSESQFESYRRLGQFLTENLTGKDFRAFTAGKDRIHGFFDVFDPRQSGNKPVKVS
jgi:Patatin-like phospholipase